jgi:hypothetical protein
MEPSPPVFDTTAAIAAVDTPAVGDFRIGNSIPRLRMNGAKGISFSVVISYSHPDRSGGKSVENAKSES